MKEERKVVVKLLEAEQTNTYKILAEFLARKFNENGFDKVKQKWFNEFVTNQGTAVLCKPYNLNIVKKRDVYKRTSLFLFYTPITWRRTNLLLPNVKPLESPA